MIYTIRIFKSWGGRSSRGQWSNTYHIESDVAIEEEEIRAAALDLAGAEKVFHLDRVHFMRAVISTFAKEGRVGHPEAVRPLELAGTGARIINVGQDPLPLDVALVLKTNAVTGRAGQMKYRGALLEAEVQGSAAGNFTLTVPNFIGAGAAMTNVLSPGEECQLVLPGAGADGTPARDIVAFAEAGVIVQKTVNRRKKKKAVNETTALDYLDEALTILGVVASVYFTKGRGIPPVARAAAAARLASLAGIIGQVIQHLTDIDLNPLD